MVYRRQFSLEIVNTTAFTAVVLLYDQIYVETEWSIACMWQHFYFLQWVKRYSMTRTK